MHKPNMCQNIEKPYIFYNKFRFVECNKVHPWMEKTQKHQTASTEQSIRLNVGVERNRSDGLGGNALDDVTLTGLSGLALHVEVDTLLLSLALLVGVFLDTSEEVLTGARVLDVLNADADALLDVAVVDNLVQQDTDGGLGHVVDDTGLTVEDLVRHTVVHHLSQRLDSFKAFHSPQIEMVYFATSAEGKSTDPWWTAPLTWMSTMSPTL